MSELGGCGNTFWARKLQRFSGKIYHLNDERSRIFGVLWSTAPYSYWSGVSGSNYDVWYSHWCKTYQGSVWAFSLPISGATSVCTDLPVHSIETYHDMRHLSTDLLESSWCLMQRGSPILLATDSSNASIKNCVMSVVLKHMWRQSF